MKTIMRVMIILLAAMTVVGAMWAVGANSGSTSSSTIEQRDDVDGAAGRLPRPEGEAGFDRNASQVLSIGGWLGFLETLVPISIIIAVVTLATNWSKRRHAQQRASAVAPI